jgi:hypothetical protein
VIFFLRKGPSRLALETRLNPVGAGYELAITTDGVTHVEPFTELPALLSREHELLQAWRAQGWRETDEAREPPPLPTLSDEEDWLGRRR